MPALYEHIPVLYAPVLEALQLQTDGCYVDATVGLGGHAAGILEQSGPNGRLLGLDLDSQALAIARKRLTRFGPRATLIQADYTTLATQAKTYGFLKAQGVLFDLGVSSLQLDRPERGFSFLVDAPLDMRFDPTAGATAADLVNDLDEADLADILWRYGEERSSRRIARRIVRARSRERITRTGQLAQVVVRAAGGHRGRIHPATRTFQALRIAVNRELERLPKGLAQTLQVLAPGGRLVVIAFHSLEDRIVKTWLRQEEGRCDWSARAPVEACPHFARRGSRPCRAQSGAYCTLPAQLRTIGKLVRPGPEERSTNPRARSARMRVAVRL